MAKSIKHYLPDGRGMTCRERMEEFARLEDELGNLYIGNEPIRKLAKGLEEDDSYYNGDSQ